MHSLVKKCAQTVISCGGNPVEVYPQLPHHLVDNLPILKTNHSFTHSFSTFTAQLITALSTLIYSKSPLLIKQFYQFYTPPITTTITYI